MLVSEQLLVICAPRNSMIHYRCFFVLGKQLSNRNHNYSRSSVLALRVETLIKQYEELKKFRDRVRRAEAREMYARTRRSRIPRISRTRSRLRAAQYSSHRLRR